MKAILPLISIYVIWGTTYLAVRIAVETIPPFLMAGTRYLIAGIILYLIARSLGTRKVKFQDWKNACFIGVSVMGICNGTVALVAPVVDSGLIACIFATGPFFLSIVAWLMGADKRPSRSAFAFMTLGFFGVTMMAFFSGSSSSNSHWSSIGLLILATLSWAYGTAITKKRKITTPILLLTSLQMIWGGGFNIIIGLGLEDLSAIDPSTISISSLTAFSYLIVFGTIVAFTSYNYLLEKVSLTVLGTHAYVNPVVALFSGFYILNEQLSSIQVIGVVLILTAVYGSLRPTRQPSHARPQVTHTGKLLYSPCQQEA